MKAVLFGLLLLLVLIIIADCSWAYNFCGLLIFPPFNDTSLQAQPVPLTSVEVHADIRGWTVGVTAQLEYEIKNTEDNIECEFVFPLVDTAAVYQLEAEIDGRKLASQVKDRKEAETEYKEAVSSGRKAALLESQVGSTDVYRLMLGNLSPNGTARVKISYVQPIDRIIDDGLLSVTLPVVLNPRYIPRHQINNPDIMAQKFHADVPYVAVSDVHYRMTFDAKVDLGQTRKIADIKTRHLNDTLQVNYGENKMSATVKLVGNFTQDHDFQLLITPATSFHNKPFVYVEPGVPQLDDSKSWLNYDVVAVWYEPVVKSVNKTTSSTSKDEYWLVVDRSGSMMGDKIEDAKSALALFVKSLPFGCKFNIIGFGSTFHVLFDSGAVFYEDKAISKAIDYSKKVEADLGGTEILEPLQFIYKQRLRNDETGGNSQRFVVLLTDGEVFNTNEVIELARQNAATTRVFAIGIGEGASTALVNGVARVSNGLAEFVRGANDQLQAKVIFVLKATTEPSADNVTFEWQITTGGHVTSTVPKKLDTTSIFAGGSASQYAVIDRLPDKDVVGYSKFSAEVGGNLIETRSDFEIKSNFYSEQDDVLPLHRLSAKKVLTELVDQFESGDNQSENVRKEAVAISIATSVLCEFTAFVAVDSAGDNETTTTTHRRKKPLFVTIERPTSYDLSQFGAFYLPRAQVRQNKMQHFMSMRGYAGSPALSSMMMETPSAHSFAIPPPAPSGNDYGSAEVMVEKSEEMPQMKQAITTTTSKHDKLMDLVMSQNFNGSWTLSNDLLTKLNVSLSLDKLRQIVADLTNTADNNYYKPSDHFVATTTTLAILRQRFDDSKLEWQLIEVKAVNYLTTLSNYPGDIDILITELVKKLNL